MIFIQIIKLLQAEKLQYFFPIRNQINICNLNKTTTKMPIGIISYCGFIYFRGHQFLWIEENLHFCIH